MKIYSILLAAILLSISICNYIFHYQTNTIIDEALLVSSILCIGGACYLIRVYIVLPLDELRKITNQCLGKEIIADKNTLTTATSLILKLNQQIDSATEYVRQIEKGSLATSYPGIQPGSDVSKESLAGTLISLSRQLSNVANTEKEHNWTSEGLARFADILRTHAYNITAFSDQVITQIVKYLQANQGSFFLYREQPEPGLDMVATYAYDRKKYIHKHIEIGQGLLGQAFLEQQCIYLTDIPDNYVSISSGLGGTTPKSLLIVPLICNEQVLGMIEIASFHRIEKYQIAFLEKLAESIASTLLNVKNAEQTKNLLEESQQYTQMMKTQEEELRQNMEELIATQENQQRLQQELKANEESLQLKIAELQESKKVLEAKENELKVQVEKSQKKSSQFKEKMEQLDMEMEGKDSMIHVLKQEKAELQEKLSVLEAKQ